LKRNFANGWGPALRLGSAPRWVARGIIISPSNRLLKNRLALMAEAHTGSPISTHLTQQMAWPATFLFFFGGCGFGLAKPFTRGTIRGFRDENQIWCEPRSRPYRDAVRAGG
jgi:hypothetical protein